MEDIRNVQSEPPQNHSSINSRTRVRILAGLLHVPMGPPTINIFGYHQQALRCRLFPVVQNGRMPYM